MCATNTEIKVYGTVLEMGERGQIYFMIFFRSGQIRRTDTGYFLDSGLRNDGDTCI